MMKKVLDWLLTIIFAPIFLLSLLLYHPFLMLFTIFPYRVYAIMPNALMWTIGKLLHLTGASYSVLGKDILKNLPKDRPLIVVSNHQSMFDISAIGVAFLRTHHIKFISKKELAKGIPSISWNLRHGKHALIDRNNKSASIRAIKDFTKEVITYNFGACIFVEGTRSRDGKMKPFKTAGFEALFEDIPNALIVPVGIENFWRLTRYKLKPIESFIPLKLHILSPIEPNNKTALEVLNECEQVIKTTING